MLFQKLDRIAIAVKDIEQAKRDFSNWFGVEYHPTYEDAEMDLKVSLPKNIGLELVAPMGKDSWVGQAIEQHGEGFFCAVIKVSDIQAAAKELERKGLKRIGQLQRCGSEEIIYDGKDIYGITIVINEYPEASGVGIEVDKFFAKLAK